MRVLSTRLFTLALILCLAVTILPSPAPGRAAAATYYVAVNGSDSGGDGSSGRPWATISHAVREAPDGSLVLVRAGTYTGAVRLYGRFASGITIRSETPYMAKLRNNGQVVIASGYTSNITLEGFDIAHSGAGAGVLVVHISGEDTVGSLENVTLRNNIIHDSYNNDLMKIDGSASRVLVAGNIFYNQSGSDEHIDINSAANIVVQDNIFLNDFASSGRSNRNDTGSFVVIKDSGRDRDEVVGSRNITLRRNIFMNYQGLSSSTFIMIGEDGWSIFEAQGVLLENNLLLGNSRNNLNSGLVVYGSKDITFRNNTVTGDMPSGSFAMRLGQAGDNRANENIRFYNNIWSDPTGTMGAQSGYTRGDFSDTRPGSTLSFALSNNVYWNGGKTIPSDSADKINYTNDSRRILGNPGLQNPTGVAAPTWDASARRFRDGSSTIREAFLNLVKRYAKIPTSSAAVDASDPTKAPAHDILGNARSGTPDAGAYEAGATLKMYAVPGDGRINVSWAIDGDLPDGSEWRVEYSGPEGNPSSPVTGIDPGARSIQLTGMRNYYQYTVTVSALHNGETIHSVATRALPTDHFSFLPSMVHK